MESKRDNQQVEGTSREGEGKKGGEKGGEKASNESINMISKCIKHVEHPPKNMGMGWEMEQGGRSSEKC